jgi:hypothetical protein
MPIRLDGSHCLSDHESAFLSSRKSCQRPTRLLQTWIGLLAGMPKTTKNRILISPIRTSLDEKSLISSIDLWLHIGEWHD